MLSACANTPSEKSTSSPDQTLETKTTAFANILNSHFRGKLFYKNKKAYFQSCNDTPELQIVTNTTLQNIYQQMKGDNDTPVYVEFTGELQFPEEKRSASSVQVRVDHIQHMALAKTSLQCMKTVDTFR